MSNRVSTKALVSNRKKSNFNRKTRILKLTKYKLYEITHNCLCNWDTWHYCKLTFLFYVIPWQMQFSNIFIILEDYCMVQHSYLCCLNWFTNKTTGIILVKHIERFSYLYIRERALISTCPTHSCIENKRKLSSNKYTIMPPHKHIKRCNKALLKINIWTLTLEFNKT